MYCTHIWGYIQIELYTMLDGMQSDLVQSTSVVCRSPLPLMFEMALEDSSQSLHTVVLTCEKAISTLSFYSTKSLCTCTHAHTHMHIHTCTYTHMHIHTPFETLECVCSY